MSKVFVAGGTGYIGRRFVQAARDQGLQLTVLTRDAAGQERLHQPGVDVIVGDLGAPGSWQDRAREADAAVFIASPPTWGKKVTRRVAENLRDTLTHMTRSFFEQLGPHIGKVVYVAGTSYYGHSDTPLTEDAVPHPIGWGPYIAPAVEIAQDFVRSGGPAVLAFPGMVYGPESWLDQLILRPLHMRLPIYELKGYDPIISPVHVEDCGRALAHLLQHGVPGEPYFVADAHPVTMRRLIQLASSIADRPARELHLPTWLCTLVQGPVVTEYATANTLISGQKLRDLGFTFKYPSLDEGLRSVVHQWQALHPESIR